MHNHIIEELVDALPVEELDPPVWMDKDGTEVSESDAYDCKVTHKITRPDYCLVMDEIGGNISHKGDGHVDGELHMCERVTTPQHKIS